MMWVLLGPGHVTCSHAIRLSPSSGADPLGYINPFKSRNGKETIKQLFHVRTRTNPQIPQPISTAQEDLSVDPAHGKTPPPID